MASPTTITEAREKLEHLERKYKLAMRDLKVGSPIYEYHRGRILAYGEAIMFLSYVRVQS